MAKDDAERTSAAPVDSKAAGKMPSVAETRRLTLAWIGYFLVGTLVALALPAPADDFFVSPFASGAATKLFTPEELAQYDGVVKPRRYLAIVGHVFDVTDGAAYTENGGYGFFVGKDASRAFSSGHFEGAAEDDVSDLDEMQQFSVIDWLSFYMDHETYKYVGLVKGRYVDDNGGLTKAFKDLEAIKSKVTNKRDMVSEFLKIYPACNSRWRKDVGSELWCAKGMMGLPEEKWPLLPRMALPPGSDNERCVCVEKREAITNPGRFHPLPNCGPEELLCKRPPSPKLTWLPRTHRACWPSQLPDVGRSSPQHRRPSSSSPFLARFGRIAATEELSHFSATGVGAGLQVAACLPPWCTRLSLAVNRTWAL
mmetsp:Transcript_26064/g.73914  ORF Transcript_26064/g.73914 Transcript_26064/m.73914 type:complete len:368 (-) Transcript_26064:18-1121(-)